MNKKRVAINMTAQLLAFAVSMQAAPNIRSRMDFAFIVEKNKYC